MRRHDARIGLIVLACLTVGAAMAACGGGDKPAQDPSSTSGGSAMPPASMAPPASAAPSASAAPAASATASANPLTTVLTTDPNVLLQMFQAAAAAATATPQAAGPAVAGDAVDAGLKGVAAKHAPGMQPEGLPAKGTLQEGGHLEMLVTLAAGKCYSVVGYSPAGAVKDLDLHLLAPPFYNILSGEDTTDDNTPVIGKGPNAMCPVIPVPIPYKVDIFAQKGGGPVAVQLYSKTK